MRTAPGNEAHSQSLGSAARPDVSSERAEIGTHKPIGRRPATYEGMMPGDSENPARKPRFRLLRAKAWLVSLLAAAALLAAYAWPTDLKSTDSAHVAVSWAAFLVMVFRFHIGIALLAVGAFAAWMRMSRLLALIAVLLVPTFGPAAASWWPRRGEALAPGQTSLVVMSANLLYGRADYSRLRSQIDRAKPDVIVFQEFTPDSAAALATLHAEYPYRVEHPQTDAFGQAIYSKREFVGPARLFPGVGHWLEPQIRVAVMLEGEPVPIVNVHLLPPASFQLVREHREQAAWMSEIGAAELATSGAVVMAGDFNATPGTAHYRAMERAGLRESQALAGTGRGTTWPRTSFLRFAPGIRLDHIFIGGGLVCVEAQRGEDCGSDHRPIVARIVRAR